MRTLADSLVVRRRSHRLEMKVLHAATGPTPWRSGGVLLAALACVAACGATEPADRYAGNAAATDDAGVEPSEFAVPFDCAATTPQLSAACARALREICEQHQDEPSCARERAYAFEQSIFSFRCGWSKVVRFSDLSSCRVESVRGRCDLYGVSPLQCPALCENDEPGGLYYRLTTRLRDHELVINPCFGANAMDGPIGEWDARTDPQNLEDAYQTCGGHEPPPPRELCDCKVAACDAH